MLRRFRAHVNGLIRFVTDVGRPLRGTVFVLVATLIAVLIAGAEHDAGRAGVPGPVASEPDPAELAALATELTPQVARRVERIRDLRFREVPEPRVTTTARLRSLTERALSRPRVRRGIRVTEAELRLLGMLDPNESLADVASEGSGLAAAFYDTRRNRLFFLGDAVPAGRELTEFILAHELTHALEDQAFGLPEDIGVSDDGRLARRALVEGTATALMGEYARRHLDPVKLSAAAASLEAGTDELPRFAVSEVRFAYAAGAQFVQALRQTSPGWSVIDYAYRRRAPTTTEQILHPTKFLANELPRRLPVPPAPPGAWERVDSSRLGEFATGLVLREGQQGFDTRVAAAGWDGDRLTLWRLRGVPAACRERCRETHALSIRWLTDTPLDRAQLRAGAARYLRGALDATPAGRGIWRLERGWAALASDTGVALALAPTRAAARSLVADP